MKKYNNKTQNIVMTTVLCILLCSGCSSTSQTPAPSDVSEKQTDADITIPSILIGDELSQITSNNAVADNGDGTVTYSLTGGEIDGILEQISSNISDSIQDILDNDDMYPDITAITPNEDCTSFTISLTDGQMNIYESMLVMSFYTIGNRYQIYSGVPSDKAVTTVIYVNDSDGSIVSQSDSSSVDTFSPN